MRRRVGNDAGLLRQLLAVFAEEGPRLLAEARGALAGADARRLQRAAHSLKGAVGTLGGTKAFEAAQRLETLAREGDCGRAGQALGELEGALAEFRAALDALGRDLDAG